MLNNKGISLITLVITITVMIILASITVFNSFDLIEDSQVTKLEKEYNDVCTFVTNISTKAVADIIDLSLTESTLASTEQISEFFEDTNENAIQIELMNQSITDPTEGVDPKYGYHYITGSQIENGIPGIEESSKLENVENDYIINFYYGVVVARISETKTNVMGAIR